MNGQIKDMVSNDIQTIEMIIQCKREKRDETAGIKSPDVSNVMNVPDKNIIDNINKIIKVERTMKGIGINKKTQTADKNNGQWFDK